MYSRNISAAKFGTISGQTTLLKNYISKSHFRISSQSKNYLQLVMKNYNTIFCLICFLLVYTFTSDNSAQWVPSNGPWGGSVNSFISVGGNYVYAATRGDGNYVSDNLGLTWARASQVGLSNGSIRCFARSGSSLYAGTEGGVFLSTNNGESWFAINSGIYNQTINSILISGSTIFAGSNGGVYITTNNGAMWYNSSYGMTNQEINSLVTLGNALFAATNGGIFKSTDFGSSWVSANVGLISQNVNTLCIVGTNIFAGTSYSSGAQSVYRSSNLGVSWTSSGLQNQSVLHLMYSIPFIYAGTASGIYRTSDNGISWSAELGLSGRPVQSVYTAGSNLLVGTNEGIFLSVNGGTAWDAVGYRYENVWSIDGSTSNIWVTGNHKVYLSSNNGFSWINRTGDLDPAYRYTNIGSTINNVYVTFVNNNLTLTGVFKSSNNGINWDWMHSEINKNIACMEVVSDSLIFIGFYYRSGNYGIYKFDGSYFEFLGLPNLGVYDIAVKDSFIFAAANTIYRSSNLGSNWINTGLSASNLAVHNNIVYAGGSGVFRSVNYGVSWDILGLTDKNISGITVNGNRVIAGTYDEGIFFTLNGGVNWFQANDGFDSIPNVVPNFAIKDSIVYAVIDGLSIWKRPLAGIIGIVNTGTEIPSSFSLYQNYPNPFNPSTNIRFDVQKPGFISIKIYDMLGREIALIVNEQLKPGTYQVDWDGTNFTSGVYFYTMRTEGYTQTKRMVLIK
jgi:hypothetical protein